MNYELGYRVLQEEFGQGAGHFLGVSELEIEVEDSDIISIDADRGKKVPPPRYEPADKDYPQRKDERDEE